MLNVKQTIYSAIQDVIEDLGLEVSEIHDDDALVDGLGLKSLDLARLVAILELKLDVDPFAERVAITSIRTVGDLCAAYEQCFAAPPGNTSTNDSAPVEPTPIDSRARQRELRKNALRGA
ncbi:MAG TPA: acyl carrier protein [Polyangium sp.]|nr:acyl carrier protein [Polyangium sp.]